MESQAKNDHLTVGHRVRDIVKHPAFKGFGELMLPWADNARYYDTRLDRVGSLMPYHSHVDADVVVVRAEPPDRRSGCRQDDLLRVLHRAAEAGGSGQEAHRPLLLPGKAGVAVRHRLPGRRVLLRRLAPRRLPARPGDQQEGAQRLRDQVSRGRAEGHRGSGGGGLLCFPQRRETGRRHARLLPLGRLRRRPDGGQYRPARRRRLRRRRSPQAGHGRHRLHRPVQLFERFPADIHHGQRG